MTRARFAKGQPRKREMNKLECAYGEHLEALKKSGEIRDYRYEALTLKLAHDCRFTPDFFVMAADDVIECHETKGPHVWDDAIVKLRVAAEMFPFRFKLVKRDKLTGGWTVKDF